MYRRKRIDPRVIGSFVVGAIILSVAGLLFFGPGGLFSETRTYVVHFDSSVKGLNVGSPVRFRGVKIGQVKDISVRLRASDYVFHIPVVIEIQPSRVRVEGAKGSFFETFKTTVKGEDPIMPLVQRGLRAQLQMDSLVTGQLFINMDMFPNTPIVLTGDDSEYPELPTISSSLEELTKAFEDLPLSELADKLIRSAEGVEKIFTSPNLHNALAQFDTTTTQLNMLLENLNQQLPLLTTSLRDTIAEAKATIARIDGKIEPLSHDIEQTLQSTRSTLANVDNQVQTAAAQFDKGLQAFEGASLRADQAMQQVSNLTGDDSRVLAQLNQVLQELQRTARSVRYLADELERDPQLLLRGRSGEGENP